MTAEKYHQALKTAILIIDMVTDYAVVGGWWSMYTTSEQYQILDRLACKLACQ